MPIDCSLRLAYLHANCKLQSAERGRAAAQCSLRACFRSIQTGMRPLPLHTVCGRPKHSPKTVHRQTVSLFWPATPLDRRQTATCLMGRPESVCTPSGLCCVCSKRRIPNLRLRSGAFPPLVYFVLIALELRFRAAATGPLWSQEARSTRTNKSIDCNLSAAFWTLGFSLASASVWPPNGKLNSISKCKSGAASAKWKPAACCNIGLVCCYSSSLSFCCSSACLCECSSSVPSPQLPQTLSRRHSLARARPQLALSSASTQPQLCSVRPLLRPLPARWPIGRPECHSRTLSLRAGI